MERRRRCSREQLARESDALKMPETTQQTSSMETTEAEAEVEDIDLIVCSEARGERSSVIQQRPRTATRRRASEASVSELRRLVVESEPRISEQAKAEQRKQAIAEQRRQYVEASKPLELHCSSPCVFTLRAYEAQTVLEVLEIRARQMGLCRGAAAWLRMKVGAEIVSHDKTLTQAGLCDQANFRVLNEGEAIVKERQAAQVDIFEAAADGNVEKVKFALAFAPERVNTTLSVTIPHPRISHCCC